MANNSPSGLNKDPKFNMLVDILRDTMKQDFGKNGAKFINDTHASNHTGNFYAIQGIANCTLDCTSGSTFGPGMEDFDADFVIPNGAIIYGHFTKVVLAGGSCIAYKK